MKKITLSFLSAAFCLSIGQVNAQTLPDKMVAVSNASEIELTVKDDPNRAKNDKPMVALPDGSLVFTATTADTGEELYISKNDQITLIKDIMPGETGSNPSWLTVVGDKVFFTATTSETGQELWITDGTENGTKMVKDIYAGEDDSSPFGLTAFDGKCLFFARDEESELEAIIDNQTAEEWLWVSDGTDAGTVRIGEVPTRKGIDGLAGYIVPSGDKAFFIGYHRDYNETLWVTDGTADGTKAIKDIYPVPTTGNFKTEAATIDWLTSVKNVRNDVRVVFRANTLDNDGKKIGSEIWFSDGTDAGTKWVGVDYAAGETDGSPNNTEFAFPIYYGGKVYFRAKDGVHGCEPGVSDFTAAGTHYICNINNWNNDPIHDSWGPEFPIVYNGYMFCSANGSYYYPEGSYHDSGYCLWRYNMAERGETPTESNSLIGFQYQSNWTNGVEIFPENNSDEPRWMTKVGGRMYFRAQDVAENAELWVMESVNDTPKKIVDFEGNGKPHNFTKVGTSLYFIATTANVLYKYSPDPVSGYKEGDDDVETGDDNYSKVEVISANGNTFFVYPNPATDIIQISSEYELAGIEIIDLTGKSILSQAGNAKTIDVSNLASGIYILYAKTTSGTLLTTKLTK